MTERAGAPNLLVRGTTLESLGRVPPSAEALWARAHRLDGGAVLASGLLVERLPVIYERLGLAVVAASELARAPLGSLQQRLLTVALFELAGGLLARAGALARALFDLDGVGAGPESASGSAATVAGAAGGDGRDGPALPALAHPAVLEALAGRAPALAAALAPLRARLRRMDALAAEATDPRRLRFEREPAASDAALIDPDRVVLTAEGVELRPGARRRWQPLAELAAELLGDATTVVDALAVAAARLYDEGRGPPLDRRLDRR